MKQETPKNQNNETTSLQNNTTLRLPKIITTFVPHENVDQATRSSMESRPKENKIPRYVSKYTLATTKDKSTLTSDSYRPKN